MDISEQLHDTDDDLKDLEQLVERLIASEELRAAWDAPLEPPETSRGSAEEDDPKNLQELTERLIASKELKEAWDTALEPPEIKLGSIALKSTQE